MVSKMLNLFLRTYSTIAEREDDLVLDISVEGADLLIPNADVVMNATSEIKHRDKFILTITISEEPTTLTSSTSDAISQFLQRITTLKEYADGTMRITLVINKGRENSVISVYSLDLFSATLLAGTTFQALTILSRALGSENKAAFETIDSDIELVTSCFSFSKTPIALHGFDKAVERITSLKSSSFFSELRSFRVTPDFFRVNDTVSVHPINKLFDRLTLALSVIYLFDISSIEGDELTYRINGYRSINGKIDLKTTNRNLSQEYFSIYEWVYTGGNLNDKIGLTRNILTLHFEEPGCLTLKGSGTLHSIRSSFKIYEKQNIKQYVEIRNKVTDQLSDFNERANKIIDSFASGFQKSIFGLTTFYTSAIVIRALGVGKFTDVFTLDASTISTALLLISVIYCKVAYWEAQEQRNRFETSYKHLKLRYTDLLEKDDIKRILNDDREFSFNLTFIQSKLKWYTVLWGLALGILFVTTWGLYLRYHF